MLRLRYGLYSLKNGLDLSLTINNRNDATKKYTAYSRANLRFDMNVSDIELLLINRNGKKKVILNKYSNFEDAHKEMEELNCILLPSADLVETQQ